MIKLLNIYGQYKYNFAKLTSFIHKNKKIRCSVDCLLEKPFFLKVPTPRSGSNIFFPYSLFSEYFLMVNRVPHGSVVPYYVLSFIIAKIL